LQFVDKTPTQLSRHRHNIKASWILEWLLDGSAHR
jgi:hypothetical protein